MNSAVEKMEREWYSLFEPPDHPPLSEWMETHFRLSPEYSNKTGKITLRGWQKPIFDTFTNPRINQISLCCGTQLIKTLFIQGATAYVIARGLGPTLVAQPTDPDGLAFSKERIAPMQRDIEAIRGKLAEEKSRTTSNTILHKDFPGGSLSITGTVSPGNVARRTLRNFFGDEVDLWTWSAKGKGHPFYMGKERVVTFGSRHKIIAACSPTIAGRSLIEQQINLSDDRRPWVPCPHCGVFQELVWKQIKWDHSIPLDYQAESAYYECSACRAEWDDLERWKAVELTEYRALRPFRGHAGFSKIWHIFSPYKRHSHMVQQWLDQHADRETLKVFVNTTLAELWEERGETPDWKHLHSDAEDYPFGAEPAKPNSEAVVPAGGLILVSTVDVQESPPRLEYEVFALGRNREKWSVAYGVIQVPDGHGGWLPVTAPELWDVHLAKVLMSDWKHECGEMMRILCMGIDTGKRPDPVYRFARQHPIPIYGKFGAQIPIGAVIPLKGNGREQSRVIAGITGDDAARKRGGIRIVSLGVNVIKPTFFDSLRLLKPAPGRPFPHGYRHHPRYEESYFQGLCGEERMENGTYKKTGRNEPVDLGVYCEGLSELIGLHRFTENEWVTLERALAIDPSTSVQESGTRRAEESAPPPPPPPAPEPEPEQPPQSDWFRGRGRNWRY